ncbi:MAG TPA: transporter [Bryobacteraceae bacterium]|nr:transporter [Bryobacteraceae bacterium]
MSCKWIARLLLAVAAPAVAQDFTQPSGTVGRGAVQVESSTILSGDAGGRGLTGPAPLIRIGVTDRLEVRAGSNGIQHGFGPDGVTGAADPTAGVMFRVADEARWRPEVALIGTLSLPFGSPEVTSAEYDPGATVAWSKQMPRGFDVAGNLSVGSVSGEGRRVLMHAQSLAAGHPISHGFRGYIEMYRVTPAGCGHRAVWVANAGFSRDIGKNRGIDVEVGRSFAGGTRGWSVVVGFTTRLPFGAGE